ncbi:cache domain-containing protein [Methanolacinia paynteri]|uniref:cache domain-containing protein n=1 Tax=Methanolacinia paynteri TaxID=230356 RepID=UPI00064E38F2|nr:cache domain-containing protein [Methanolacinia paynteri]
MKNACSILSIAVIAMAVLLSSGCTTTSEICPACEAAQTADDSNSDSLMQASLSELQGETYTGLDDLFSRARDCAGSVGTADLQEKISEAASGKDYILTVAYIGSDGVLNAISPESEGINVGDSLAYQDSVARMNENKTPLLTDLFELKQGGYAAAVYYPVFSGDSYLGFISITFVPETFFSKYAKELKEESGFEVMVLQTDGLILYDPDESEAGQQTFNNPAYEDFPGIIEAAEKVVKDWSGSCEYSYYATGTKDEIVKKAFWSTVDTGGNEWRIMVIKNIGEE